MAERQPIEQSQQPSRPHMRPRPTLPVVPVDGDEYNANWLRILDQERQRQQQQQQQQQRADRADRNTPPTA